MSGLKLFLLLLAPLVAPALSLNNGKTKEVHQKAVKGDSQSQYDLALLYLDDRGADLKKSEREAFKWLMKAAEAGHIKAQTKLGELYEVGRGVEQDTNQAVRWYKKAADAGDAQARRALEFLPYDDSQLDESPLAKAEDLYKKREFKAALAAFEPLAKEGNPQAQYMFGRMHLNAQGVTRDYVAALEWTTKAAEQGHAKAMYSLGLYYRNGWGVEKDLKTAAEWFSKAASLGDPDAARAYKEVAPQEFVATNSIHDPSKSATATSTATNTEASPPPPPEKKRPRRSGPMRPH